MMLFWRSIAAVSFTLVLGSPSWAQELDAESALALSRTQQLLQDPDALRQFIAAHPAARSADRGVRELSSSDATTADIYSLASEVLESMVKDANGDSAKLKKLISDAQANPEAFAETWTP